MRMKLAGHVALMAMSFGKASAISDYRDEQDSTITVNGDHVKTTRKRKPRIAAAVIHPAIETRQIRRARERREAKAAREGDTP